MHIFILELLATYITLLDININYFKSLFPRIYPESQKASAAARGRRLFCPCCQLRAGSVGPWSAGN